MNEMATKTAPARTRAPGKGRTGRKGGAAAAAAERDKRAAEDAFVRLDRRVHARLGAVTNGVSMLALAEAWADWASHLALSPGKQFELAWKAGRKWQRFSAMAMRQLLTGPDKDCCIEPLPQDRRFAAPEWQQFPWNLVHQSFLLTQQWWHNAATGIHGVDARNERLVEFYGRQMLDMVAPSNFLATNPEIIAHTFREGGQNLIRGWGYWVEDAMRLATGAAAEIPADFRPGEGVAVTPGKVVFRNDLMELIQYAPATATVHSVPILIVPAWIMRYYILDLRPGNSLVRWLVGQGFTVFCISWKNPDAGDRDLGFDDYIADGVMAALDAVCAITGAPAVNAAGYCLGGTLLAVAAAAMARDGDDRIATLSMLAAQVDFSEAGELSLFTSEAQIALLEDMMWESGYLDQRQMAGTFNVLKSRDLIWSRNAREYLWGEADRWTDLGAWSADATRMPYRMHSEYLRRFFLDNDFAQGRLVARGNEVYLTDIRAPVFAVATERDHIAPWQSVFKLTHLLHGDATFALVSGGHNTGIVAPPGHPSAHRRVLFHRSGDVHTSPDDWAGSVAPVAGSWWQDWADWLQAHADSPAPQPPLGRPEAGYPPGDDAPGTYVRRP